MKEVNPYMEEASIAIDGIIIECEVFAVNAESILSVAVRNLENSELVKAWLKQLGRFNGGNEFVPH